MPPERAWRRFLTNFVNDDVFGLSAAVAFYTTLAVSPLLLLALTVVGSLYPGTQERIIVQLVELAGTELEPLLRQIISSADERPDLRRFAGWVSIGVLLATASVLFAQLQYALNRIFRAQNAKMTGILGFLRRRLLSVGVLLTLLFVSIMSLALQAALSAVSEGAEGIWVVAASAFDLVVYTVLFSALYRWLPDRHVPWASALRGGLLTAALFTIGRAAIGAYLAHSDAAGAFGPAGSVVLLLLWAYYSAIVFLGSAEIVYAIAQARGWRWIREPPGKQG